MMKGEAEMLRFLGLKDMEELFEDIPPEVRTKGAHLPEGLSEEETVRKVEAVLARNAPADGVLSFLGEGYYDMYVPAAVDAILSRSEFYTSYTPYQAEISQGLMQALFEYQSLICELTGMDVANSSMYDASSALGEAALMCFRIARGREFIVPRTLHPERLAVLRNYARGAGLKVREVEFNPTTGTLDLDHLSNLVSQDTSGIYVENPNLFGLLDGGLLEIKTAHPKTLVVVGVNPLSLGVLKPPAEYGADIVVGEGQPLGTWVNFGGPSLGLFACQKEHLRKMPGRVIGLTKDAAGNRAFCMTLQTREQHIRKEKAMSNICTNEALLAVGAAAYLALRGAAGLRRLSVDLMRKAKQLMDRLAKLDGYRSPLFGGSYFNEFAIGLPVPHKDLRGHLLSRGIYVGADLGSWFPELGSSTLLAVTDRHRAEDFERLAAALKAMR